MVAPAAFARHTQTYQPVIGFLHAASMHPRPAIGSPRKSSRGLHPYIPVEDAFTTSALKPTGNIPPEFVEFNNYDPEVSTLLATQICARPYIPYYEKSLRASPGELVAETGRCRPYVVTIRNLEEVFLP